MDRRLRSFRKEAPSSPLLLGLRDERGKAAPSQPILRGPSEAAQREHQYSLIAVMFAVLAYLNMLWQLLDVNHGLSRDVKQSLAEHTIVIVVEKDLYQAWRWGRQ